MWKKLLVVSFVVALLAVTVGVAQRESQELIEPQLAVESAWTVLRTEYQRRETLVGNLNWLLLSVAPEEKKITERLGAEHARLQELRPRVGTIAATPNDNLTKFGQLQDELRDALAEYEQVAKKYPRLRTNKNYQILSGQLGSLNARIKDAEEKYNEPARAFNQKLQAFPDLLGNWNFKYRAAPEF